MVAPVIQHLVVTSRSRFHARFAKEGESHPQMDLVLVAADEVCLAAVNSFRFSIAFGEILFY